MPAFWFLRIIAEEKIEEIKDIVAVNFLFKSLI